MVNTLYTGDNLYILNGMDSKSFDLIYLDPPFNSKRVYSAPIGTKAAGAAFADVWKWSDVDEIYLNRLIEDHPYLVRYIQSIRGTHGNAMMSYITYMTQRIIEIHRVLKNTGSVYLHVDPTASHYLKVIFDEVFGKNNFRNEIVWYYRRWTAASKKFQRMHDVILFYSKSEIYTFNKQSQPFSQKTRIARYKRKVVDGRAVQDKTREMTRSVEKGVSMHDVWEIPFIHPVSKERTGYPTQKPLALLHRIIKASSDEGDIVLDPFCGCATTCVAAQQLERQWVGIDIEEKAIEVLLDRLKGDAGLFKNFVHTKIIPERTDINKEPLTQSMKKKLFEQQNGTCNACDVEMRLVDFEVDHIIPKSKGGGDYYKNCQLLCGNCNRIKGNRPMEYLRMKIRKREELMKNELTFGE